MKAFVRFRTLAAGAGPLRWRPTPGVAVIVGAGLALSFVRLVGQPSAFLYFRF